MNTPETIRESVSEAYAKAITEPAGSGCCAQTPQKGAVAKLAGYREAELQNLPGEAVANSFGCGNPLAFSEVKEGEVVLDLGSGAGIDLLLAAKNVIAVAHLLYGVREVRARAHVALDLEVRFLREVRGVGRALRGGICGC